MYEGGKKINATNDVKWQLKVGLHFCLFQTFNVLSFHRYTEFQSFNPIIERFLVVFLGTSLRRSNVAAPNFWREVYYLPARFFLETREEKKVTGDYIKRIGWMF